VRACIAHAHGSSCSWPCRWKKSAASRIDADDAEVCFEKISAVHGHCRAARARRRISSAPSGSLGRSFGLRCQTLCLSRDRAAGLRRTIGIDAYRIDGAIHTNAAGLIANCFDRIGGTEVDDFRTILSHSRRVEMVQSRMMRPSTEKLALAMTNWPTGPHQDPRPWARRECSLFRRPSSRWEKYRR